jgi:hypothetical protein
VKQKYESACDRNKALERKITSMEMRVKNTKIQLAYLKQKSANCILELHSDPPIEANEDKRAQQELERAIRRAEENAEAQEQAERLAEEADAKERRDADKEAEDTATQETADQRTPQGADSVRKEAKGKIWLEGKAGHDEEDYNEECGDEENSKIEEQTLMWANDERTQKYLRTMRSVRQEVEQAKRQAESSKLNHALDNEEDESYDNDEEDEAEADADAEGRVEHYEGSALPDGWMQVKDDTGKVRFIDHNTKTTTYDDPRLH